MRLDYALYGLAVILFAVTIVTIASVAEQDGRTIFAISTSVVGVLSIGGGYFLRPRAKAAEAANSPAPKPETIAPATVAEADKSEVQKLDTPRIEQQAAAAPQGAEQVLTTPATTVENTGSKNIETPVTVSPSHDVALPAPPVQVAIPAPSPSLALGSPAPVEINSKSEFSQIRGISEKRVDQLKANGIRTIQELANASADDLAAKLDLSPRIVKMWIGCAKKIVK